eukprot:c47739_g1_i1 orf=94-567(+)
MPLIKEIRTNKEGMRLVLPAQVSTYLSPHCPPHHDLQKPLPSPQNNAFLDAYPKINTQTLNMWQSLLHSQQIQGAKTQSFPRRPPQASKTNHYQSILDTISSEVDCPRGRGPKNSNGKQIITTQVGKISSVSKKKKNIVCRDLSPSPRSKRWPERTC